MSDITITNVDLKPTSRIRNYVKNNESKVKKWLGDTIRLYLHRKIYDTIIKDTVDYSDKKSFKPEDIAIFRVVYNRRSHGIYRDLMRSYYKIADDGGFSGIIRVRGSVVTDLVKDKGSRPDFEELYRCQRVKRTRDTYTSLCYLSLPEVIYIYNNIDEFDFIIDEIRHSRDLENRLKVIPRDEIDHADTVSFKNSIDSYYIDKIDVIGKVILDKDLTYLHKMKRYTEKSTVNNWGDYFLGVYCFDTVKEMRTEHISEKLKDITFFIDILNKKKQAYQDILDFIKESGGDEKFKEIYYKKMIDHFYKDIPINMASDDAMLSEMCNRACKKRYDKL